MWDPKMFFLYFSSRRFCSICVQWIALPTWNIVVEEMHCSTVSWTCIAAGRRVVRFIHYITWQCIRAVMILYCNTLHNTIIHWTSFALQEPVHHSSDEIPQGSEQSLLSALRATAEGNSQPDLTKIIIQHTNTLLAKKIDYRILMDFCQLIQI